MVNDQSAIVGLRALPFYLGGFLGPFGTMVIIPMLPELRDHFGVDTATISWGFSAYLFPMAGLMLVSGTIGERYGRKRVLQLSLSAYVAASILVAMAPSLGVFLAARAVQGAANSFFTPLLIAGLADVTPAAQLGRRVGIYASFQAVGGGLAPFAGGMAAAIDWRYAFWLTALCALVIVAFVPPGGRRTGSDRPPIRPLLSTRLLLLGLGSFAAAAGPIGAGVLVGLKARDVLEMEPTTAGLLLAGGQFGAAALSPLFGHLLDRFGPRLCGVISGLVISGLVALLAFTDSVASTALVYGVAGSLFGLLNVLFQMVGAMVVPENRGGALSATLSFRFVGHAVGPIIWVPIFTRSPEPAFLGAAALGLVTVVAVLGAVPRGDEQPAGDQEAEPRPDARPGPSPVAAPRLDEEVAEA